MSGVVSGTTSSTAATIPRSTDEAAVWRDSSLVFEHGAHAGITPGTGDWTERRETWTLEPSGQLKITFATSGSGESGRTMTATFRKAR